ncbi:MAG: hypothetical protein AAGG08_18225 [Actinomycetota bacterium]
MNDLKTTQIMLIAGGAVLFLSSFLAWRSEGDLSVNGWQTGSFGLQGIFIALIGLAVGGGVAAQAFGNVSVPERILTLSHDQIHLALGFAAFVVNFGQQFADSAGAGALLGWISSAVIIAAAVMDLREAPTAPPTQF